jgi:hypothetical protein
MFQAYRVRAKVSKTSKKSPDSPPQSGDFFEETAPLLDRLEELGKPWVDTIDPKSDPKPAENLGSKGYIKCSAIDARWVGGIEQKTINSRQYYYWRHQVAGSFGKRRKASDYLGSTWEKAIERLRQKQNQRLES